jgi:hypothetical protein
VQNFYGTSQFVPVYIQDVFAISLYSGNGTTQTIVSGVNSSAKGGMVWCKSRNTSGEQRSVSPNLNFGIYPNLTNGSLNGNGVTFPISTYYMFATSNGFGFPSDDNISLNTSGINYVGWTFAEQSKFFDIVNFTGDGTSTRTISHNLGSAAGSIWVKSLDGTSNWKVWHRKLGTGAGGTGLYCLNSGEAMQGTLSLQGGYCSGEDFSTTTFTVNSYSGSVSEVNANGTRYVAYLFAHNAGGFGATGTDNVISCGQYTGNGAVGGQLINLGYEAVWVIIKNSQSGDWWMLDVPRGWGINGDYGGDPTLFCNSSSGEQNQVAGEPAPTGFRPIQDNVNQSGQNYIYIAIRKPM